jgi:cell division protein FtsN
MEGKKVLWVIFSVTLVLAVVLGAGLFLLRPKPKAAETAVREPPSVQGFDAYEYVRGSSEAPGLAPAPGEPPKQMTIVVGEQPGQAAPAVVPEPAVTVQPAPTVQPALAPQPEPVIAKQPAPAAQPAPAPQPEPVIARQPAPAAQPAPAPQPEPAIAQEPAPAAQPAPAPQAEQAPAPRIEVPPAKAAPAPKPAARPAPRQIRVTEYWIQTGAYSSASRADEVVRELAEKGLATKVSTRQINGKTSFRVRVGPYASKSEANKFLAWIQDLKGFESSYISMVSARRIDP